MIYKDNLIIMDLREQINKKDLKNKDLILRNNMGVYYIVFKLLIAIT